MDQDRIFMKEAIRLSEEGVMHNMGGPFGAVVVKHGKVIGKGFNEVTSTNDPTAHAEIQAIRNASSYLKNFDLSGCAIYCSCEPCPMCLSAIYWARIGKIYFANTRKEAAAVGFDDDFIYSEIPKLHGERLIPIIQIPDSKAKDVFDIWLKKENKTKY